MANEPVYNKRGMGKTYITKYSSSYNRIVKSVSKHARRIGETVNESDALTDMQAFIDAENDNPNHEIDPETLLPIDPE